MIKSDGERRAGQTVFGWRAAFATKARIGSFLIALAAFLALSFYLVRLSGLSRALTFEVEMSASIDREPVTGQVFWSDGGAYSEEASARFSLRENHAKVELTGARADALTLLRLDPVEQPGTIRISHSRLCSFLGPCEEWTASQMAEKWRPAIDIEQFEYRDGSLQMRAISNDPSLVLDNLRRFRARCRQWALAISIALGLILGVIHHLTTASLFSASAVASMPFTSKEGGKKALTALLATAVALTVVLVVWARWRHAAPQEATGYSTTLVDHQGRPLSNKRGDLLLEMDPVTIYRNLPNQKTPRFTIDENGFRGGIPASKLPIAMVLGGSTAFGYSLDSDSQTFTSQLNQIVPRYRFVNAGVTGYCSGQELSLVLQDLVRFGPRLYVVFDGVNDMYQLANRDAGARFGFNQPMYEEITAQLLECVDSKRPASGASRSRAIGYEENFRAITDRYVENMLILSRFAADKGAELLVVFQPDLGSKRQSSEERPIWKSSLAYLPERFSEMYRRFIVESKRRLESAGVRCLDLNSQSEIKDNPSWLFSDSVHLNARGHRLVAELIGRELDQGASHRPSPRSTINH